MIFQGFIIHLRDKIWEFIPQFEIETSFVVTSRVLSVCPLARYIFIESAIWPPLSERTVVANRSISSTWCET